VSWEGLVRELGKRYAETRFELREVGEEVRAKRAGCGEGGGCGRPDCAAARPTAVSGAGRSPRPLPMARG